jgi:hypothetical protein
VLTAVMVGLPVGAVQIWQLAIRLWFAEPFVRHDVLRHVERLADQFGVGHDTAGEAARDARDRPVPLLMLGAGLTKHVAGSVSVTAGCRYTDIDTFAPASNANMTYVGVSFGR